MERLSFPSLDGGTISLLLERPAGTALRPCVVFLHGGHGASARRRIMRGICAILRRGAL